MNRFKTGLKAASASFVALCLAVLLPFPSEAKNLPALPEDESVISGTFDNGIHYWLLPNSTEKGLVSMALLQQNVSNLSMEELVDVARRRFSSPGPVADSFESFLSRNAVAPREGGYLIVVPRAVCCVIDDYLMDNSRSVTDSLLFSFFSMARAAAAEGVPSDCQAFVACGDFDKTAFLAQLKTAALLCPHVSGQAPPLKFIHSEQNRRDSLRMEGGQKSGVVVEWHAPHIPAKFMKSVLPFVSDKMANEFSWIIGRRLSPAFRSGGYNTWMEVDYTGSSDTGTDESLKVRVGCPSRQRVWVMDIMERELNRLLTWGVGENEYTYARDSYHYEWKSASRPCIYDNREGLKRCSAAFLFGSSLATEEEKMKFVYRQMPDSIQTRLFNNYMKRLLVQTAKPDSTLDPVPECVPRSVVASAVRRYEPTGHFKESKVRIRAEHVMGGKLFTFPNGLNVVWHGMDTKGFCRYAYASKGGRRWASTDIFNTIDGIYEGDFANYLSSQGISQEVKLEPSDVILCGKAPEECLEELLRVLAAQSAQESVKKVFGDECYKLLVLCTSRSEESVLSLLSSYATVLGPSGEWNTGNSVAAAPEDYFKYRDFRLAESVFPYDLSTSGNAVSSVAVCALERAIARHFGGKACSCLCRGRFAGFPSDEYRLLYGVREEPLDGFALNEGRVERFTHGEQLRGIVEDLSSSLLPPDELALCRKAALNRNQSLSSTPEYAVMAICCRYLYNRDVFSRLPQTIASVSADEVRDFFKPVLANFNYIP